MSDESDAMLKVTQNLELYQRWQTLHAVINYLADVFQEDKYLAGEKLAIWIEACETFAIEANLLMSDSIGHFRSCNETEQ